MILWGSYSQTKALAFTPFTAHNETMEKQDAIQRIKGVESSIRALGAQAVYLFGSTSRDEARADSDVDIFIDKDPTRPFGLTEFCRLEDTFTEVLGTKVDLATRESLHPVLKDEIEQSAIRVI